MTTPTAPAAPKKNRTWIVVLVVLGLGALIVPCVGVLAAIAIPSFLQYTQRAKTVEARANLQALYTGAAAYYADEHLGPGGQLLTGCAVGPDRTPNTPGPQRTLIVLPAGSAFEALGVRFEEPAYYRYSIEGSGGCGHGPNASLYTFVAEGDLDGDGAPSRFELPAGVDGSGEFTRLGEIIAVDELE